jgi:uncharacterized membrane-anchored protein YhcB (DUF1043 family)
MLLIVAKIIGIIVGIVVGTTIFNAIFSSTIIALKINNLNREVQNTNEALDKYINELNI